MDTPVTVPQIVKPGSVETEGQFEKWVQFREELQALLRQRPLNMQEVEDSLNVWVRDIQPLLKAYCERNGLNYINEYSRCSS